MIRALSADFGNELNGYAQPSNTFAPNMRSRIPSTIQGEGDREYVIMEKIGSFQPVVAIIIGLLLLWIVFKVIKGVFRLVLSLAVIGVIAYIVLNYAR